MDTDILNNNNGKKTLTVFYDQDNFNEAIQKALADNGLKHGEAQIIAIPEKLKKLGKAWGSRQATQQKNYGENAQNDKN